MSRPAVRVFPPLPPSVYARRPRGRLPFPLDDPACRLFSLARHGLARGIEQLGLGAGDEVLTPAYHHGSEIEVFRTAGLGCRFYDATETLEPDIEELESLLGPRVRALHLIHYLGFPQDARRWRRWCDERGLLLVEDAAQAWLAHDRGSPVGSHGDVAIFSLYKTLGVPDGGATLCTGALPAPRGDRRVEATRLAKAHRSWLALRWPRVAYPRPVTTRAAQDGVPAGEFSVGDAEARPSPATGRMLPRLLVEDVADRRRRNYRALLSRLEDLVPPPFGELPAGASPFAFPVDSERKDALLDRLANAGVKALNLWSTPHPSLPEERYSQATARRRRTVGLPVHQELLPRHLELMVEAVGSHHAEPT